MNLFQQQATEFQGRHIGTTDDEAQQMLSVIGVNSVEELIGKPFATHPAAAAAPTA